MTTFKQSKIAILRDSITKVTQILSRKSIKVTQVGVSAYVERDHQGIPTSVNLPYVPDTASDDLLAAIQGFVDHEVAHILHSSGKSAQQAKAKGKKIEKLYGFFNDAHAEKAMRKEFKGSARNLSELASYYTDRRLKNKWDELETDGANQHEKLGAMMGAVVRAWSGDVFYEDFMHDKWDDLSDVLDKIPQSFIDKVKNADSSQDALNLTQEFIKYIERDQPPQQGDGDDEDSEGQSSGQSGSSSSKGSGKGDPGSDNSDGGGESEDESENEDENSGGGAGSGDDEDESEDENEDESEGGGGAGDDEDESEDESNSSGGDGEDEDEGGSDGHDSDGESSNEEQDGDAANGGDIGGAPSFDDGLDDAARNDMVNELNRDIERDLKDSPNLYIPLTTEYDTFETAPTLTQELMKPRYGHGVSQGQAEEEAAEIVKDLHEKVLENVGASSKQLEKAFVAQNRTFYEPGKRSGRLNPSSLFKLQTGDDRVFRRKVDVRAKNTAVSLVMDQSGSMSGAKIINASIACFALAEILTRINIPYEIVGFTTGSYPGAARKKIDKAWKDMERRLNRGPSRNCTINMYSYKGFDERFEYEQKQRLATAYSNNANMCANVDGESIMIAANRLAKQTAERHCMIVLSDGQPAGGGSQRELHTDLKNTVKKIESAGIDVVGLGICDKSVEKYYTNNIVFYDPEELSQRVMAELTRMLMASAYK